MQRSILGSISGVAAMIGIFSVSLSASAQTVNGSVAIAPTGSVDGGTNNAYNFDNLDHHKVYTWLVKPSLTSQTAFNGDSFAFTGASVTIQNIRNWNTDPNVLHLHLLDTAKNAGVASFVDDANATVTDLTDDFISTRFHSDPNWLVANGTADRFLANPQFTTTGVTYTYTFTTADVAALNQDFWNGGDFALGLDPDCHFFNDGVTFNATYIHDTGNKSLRTPGVVPEPSAYATIAAFALPLGGLMLRRRK